jgi:histidinol-phosphate aminotransferase
MTSAAPDRSKADHPTPKPGIDEIVAYAPGKSSAEGVENPVKLSSNENILGSSPAAQAAYLEAVAKLNVYPDSRFTALREAVSRRYRLEPERLIFGCGTDEILGRLVQQVFLEPGDNIVQGEYGFNAYGIGARACQAEVRFAPEPNLRIDVDEMLDDGG